MIRIVLTGGGTSGHVTPNIALIPELKKMGYDIKYIGSINGIEKQLIEKEGIEYYTINTGKLRRYFDLRNFTDAFRVVDGLRQAYAILGKLKPDIVFSKGGFVSCPVVWAAWLRRIPAVIHESDMTPGLTNKLSMPFAKKVCYTFPESGNYIPKDKGVQTGIPIRENLMKGSRNEGLKLCGFTGSKPVIMVIGGSLGSEKINGIVRKLLDTLLKDFNICHICGKGNLKPEYSDIAGYRQFEYVNEEQPHIFAMSDLVISRAGATVLFELLALKKPNILIPLSRAASRGDQILNAHSFEKSGFSCVLEEEAMDEKYLLKCISETFAAKEGYIAAMESYDAGKGTDRIIKVIEDCRKR
jgi:UDP-N-acetylglucosamine--N-acetylmuramyl-(pentapeptide) pyrophosphoryl-undecaprenol N-acetylglucosamine transferase